VQESEYHWALLVVDRSGRVMFRAHRY
jgi:hypothetical protein